MNKMKEAVHDLGKEGVARRRKRGSSTLVKKRGCGPFRKKGGVVL